MRQVIKEFTEAQLQGMSLGLGEIGLPTDASTVYIGVGDPSKAGGSVVFSDGAAATSLASLTDVTITGIQSGEGITWNGSAWVNGPLVPSGGIDDLDDVNTSTSAPMDGEVLVWVDANGAWEPGTAGAQNINALADVTITAAADGDYLRHNGSAWVDAVPSINDMSNVDIATVEPSANLNGLEWSVDNSRYEVIHLTDTLDDLDNVDVSTVAPQSGDALIFDGSNFVPSPSLPTDVSSPTNGQVLVYDGDTWNNETVSTTDLYSADGTITGTRTITCGTNALVWNDALQINWSTNGNSGAVGAQTMNLRDSGLLVWNRASTGNRHGIRCADDSAGSGAVADTIFSVASTNQASIPWPRMTEAQRDLIPTPTAGHVIYNTTDNKVNFYNGTGWREFSDVAG